MIIGKYVVPPTHVRYAEKQFNPETSMTELKIYLDDDTILSQWLSRDDEIKKAFKQLEECTRLAEDAELIRNKIDDLS